MCPLLNTVVGCHAIWNSELEISFMGKYVVLELIAWILALSLVKLGIKQIADEKAGKKVFASNICENF